jgi:hypothetical protein
LVHTVCADAAEQTMALDIKAERVQQLADRLNCATEDDLIALTKTKPETVDAWRRRGEGPPVIRAGCAYLYPLDGLREWLAGRVRQRKHVSAAEAL